ncbi:diguanylate phosphodiesterase [Pseudomonas hunanensis]|uniref:Diguanylate phosphodiesterase n=1 Tax=Pseudomonas hunanensis TaxID=1247546 RepID=A0ACC9MWV3_9PSED|nr:diguanylate phosphodiesterase [Pseudomonas hunanensis]
MYSSCTGPSTRDPFLRRNAPLSRCRSGFTREYGSGVKGERPVEIGQQGRPLRG